MTVIWAIGIALLVLALLWLLLLLPRQGAPGWRPWGAPGTPTGASTA